MAPVHRAYSGNLKSMIEALPTFVLNDEGQLIEFASGEAFAGVYVRLSDVLALIESRSEPLPVSVHVCACGHSLSDHYFPQPDRLSSPCTCCGCMGYVSSRDRL